MKVLLITVVVLAALFTAGDLGVSIEGFPFLTQAAGEEFGHVTLTAHRFSIDTTNNVRGGCLHVDRLHLDLRDVGVTSLTARSAEANLAAGTLTISYKELSGVVTRLAGNGGPLQVSRAAGSNGQAARVKVAGTVGGTVLNATGTLLAQGTELSLTVPGVEQAGLVWRVGLPEVVGFESARAGADGVEIGLVGHQVTLGSSRFGR